MNRPLIAITPGDPDGVGPEIAWKTISARNWPHEQVDLVVIGAREPFDRMGVAVEETTIAELAQGARPSASSGPKVWIIPAPLGPKRRLAKRFSVEGWQSGWAIETAAFLAKKGVVAALTTGPISKERLQLGGYPYPGHTEFLAKLCRVKHVTMMLANDQLRVSLVTTHLALKNVSRALTRELLRRTILHTETHLRSWWGIARPRIAVAALNPHAGEAGLFGTEEIRVIGPELKSLSRRPGLRMTLSGPHPADTLFAKHVQADVKERNDAVICMYHDQGLIPVKLLDFPRTVNVTLGLPIIRTSVDHGVGFDIAGTGKADPSSLQSALRLAVRLISNKGSLP